MSDDAANFRRTQWPLRTETLANIRLDESLAGPAGVASLFKLSSNVLIASWGVLAVASLPEVGPFGAWRGGDLPSCVARVVQTTVALSTLTEKLMREALTSLRAMPISNPTPKEIAGVKELLLIGDAYIALLQKVTLENVLAAMQQGLKISEGSDEVVSPSEEFQNERAGLVELAKQLAEIETAVEKHREMAALQYRRPDAGRTNSDGKGSSE